MNPLIGITCDYEETSSERSFVYADYYDAVASAGGLPVLVPILDEEILQVDLLDRLDGLILTGGDDYEPHWYGGASHNAVVPLHSRRQAFDMALGNHLRCRSIPTLGICCGAQLMSIACGGTLIEDIPTQIQAPLTHKIEGSLTRHIVTMSPESKLKAIFRSITIETNSKHHQSVNHPGSLHISAQTSDGVIEAVEALDHPFFIGVQWHPEKMMDEIAGQEIFRALIDSARKKR